MRTFGILATTLLAASAAAADKPAAPFDTAGIETLTGAKGALDAKEGVFKVSLPRGDINATAAGVRMTPPLGLTAWAAFTKAGKHTMVMGDIVLLEDQVNPVMSAALDNGLEVTALHNHFFWDSPKVMFMHVGGMGDDKVLAGAVGKVFARLKETAGGKGEILRADIDPAKTTLSPAKIEAVLVLQGRAQGRRLQGGRSAGRPRWAATRSASRWASTPGRRSRAATTRRSSTATSRCWNPSCSRC